MTLGQSSISTTFKHAMIYSLATILGKVIGFIMLPVYAHYLHGEGYGIIGMIDVVISVVSILIGYGIQGAMARLYYDLKTEKERNRLISTAIILMLFAVFLTGVPMMLFDRQIAWLAFGQEGLSFYIFLAILTFMLDMTAKNAETFIFIQQKSIFYVFLSLCRLILAFSLNIYFIAYLKLGVLGYLYSGLIVAMVFAVVMHFYSLGLVGVHYDSGHASEILRYCLPLIPGYVAMFIRTNINRILLRVFLNLTHVGAFEMIFKFATLIGLFVVEPFSKIWGVKRFEIADKPEAPETMARIFTMIWGMMLFVGLVLSVEIPVLLKLLTPEEFWLGGEVAALAVLSRIILASYYHLYFGLLYAKKTNKISVIQIATTIVALMLSLILIKPFGIYGAVVASCLTSTFQCIMAFVMARDYYRIPFQWKRIVVLLLCACGFFMIIDQVSPGTAPEWQTWLKQYIAPVIVNCIQIVQLDAIKDGRLVMLAVEHVGLLVDGGVKLILSFIFLFVLIPGNYISRKRFEAVFRNRSIAPLFELEVAVVRADGSTK